MQASLFDAPSEPVVIAEAGNWLTGLLGGSIAISLCVIAVGFIGLAMLAGQMPIRRGIQVVLGCFLLLGATTLVSGFVGLAQDAGGIEPQIATPAVIEPEHVDLPPAHYNPYARASVRRQ